MKKVLCLMTAGSGGQDEMRARRLGSYLDADITFVPVDKSTSYRASMQRVWDVLKSDRWDLVYQEGTGITGGINLIRAARAWGQKYIVSSGDPIGGFFHITKGPALGLVFERYERALYQACSGFVGWTPYLTGAAVGMGAKRATTIEGAVALETFLPVDHDERDRIRAEFGLKNNHLVCGVVGSLNWSRRQRYCYGLELVETIKYLRRNDVSLLIVGDGSGRAELESRVPDKLAGQVVFTGRLPQVDVVRAMNAMDVGFITQTLDRLGNFRLTTKLPEYLACGLPVAMSPIPGYFDYVAPAGWALPAHHPSSPAFHKACANWLDRLSWQSITDKAALARKTAVRHFDYAVLGRRFRNFVDMVMTD